LDPAIEWSERRSKWCGIAGRRAYIEDFSSQGYVNIGRASVNAPQVHRGSSTSPKSSTANARNFTKDYDDTHDEEVNSATAKNNNALVCLATTVVDGHLGAVSARYVATYMLRHLAKAAAAVPVPTTSIGSSSPSSHSTTLDTSSILSPGYGSSGYVNGSASGSDREDEEDDRIGGRRHRQVIGDAFHSLQARLGASLNDTSGTTATLALLCAEGSGDSKTRRREEHQTRKMGQRRTLILAHVGDSRAVACCAQVDSSAKGEGDGLDDGSMAVVATVDHSPSDPKEQERIEGQGGFVTIGDTHSKSRVNVS
jgi:hypothetical protein